MSLMLLIVTTFVVAVTFLKIGQVRAAMKGGAFQPPPEAVTTTIVKTEAWPANLTAIGTVVAVHGVSVSADLPGVVDRIPFESGAAVRQGTVLAELDTRQEKAQLAAAVAQLELARLK